MAVYIKVFDDTGEAAAVEALDPPVYVYRQPRNGMIVRCVEPLAHGVLNAEGEKIYQLEGKEPIGRAAATAAIITEAEYEELAGELGTDGKEDPEDTNPDPGEKPGEEPMTRAELTAAVEKLNADMGALTSAVEKGLAL